MDGKIDFQVHEQTRHKHLVYIRNGTTSDADLQYGFDADKVAFLINENKKSIELATSLMFTEEKCHDNQIVVINRFQKDTMAWESNNFFPSKYLNLHRCTLLYATLHVQKKMRVNDRILEEMSKVLNFTVQRVKVNSDEELDDLLCDFFDFGFSNEKISHIWVSDEKVVFVIPSGLPLTTIEKFLSPFDDTTWWLILSTLITTFCGIQVVILVSQRLQDLCFGDRIGSPTMNFLNVFL